MSKFFILAMLVVTTYCCAQTIEHKIGHGELVSIWNGKTQEFDRLTFDKDSYTPIQFLSDRIVLNRKGEKFLYFKKSKAEHSKMSENIMVTEWECKDKFDRKCSVGLLVDTNSPNTTMVVITYHKEMQYCYWLEK